MLHLPDAAPPGDPYARISAVNAETGMHHGIISAPQILCCILPMQLPPGDSCARISAVNAETGMRHGIISAPQILYHISPKSKGIIVIYFFHCGKTAHGADGVSSFL